MRPFTLFLAMRHIRRRSLQSGITIAGVAVGVMVLIIALSLTKGYIYEKISSTLRATPQVTLQSFNGSLLSEDADVLAALQQENRVVSAAPFLTGQALIARRASAQRGITGRQGFTQLIGIEPRLEATVLDLPVLLEGAQLLETGSAIVLGDSLALRQLGVYTGDEVLVSEITGRRETFEVAGTFRVGNELIDNMTSYLSIPALQAFLNAPGQISGYHVRVAEPTQASAIGSELGSRYGLLATSWEGLFSSLIEQLRLQKALIGVVVFLIIIVAAMGIANILVLTVAEKTTEIAILRALGAVEGQILRIFTLEGLLLGGSGTLLGVLLGLAVSLYFKYQPYPLPGDLYFITRLPVELQWLDVFWVSFVSVATAMLASLLPARRASRLNPAEVLR
jgi:lipoprotein-releasing system permease protein